MAMILWHNPRCSKSRQTLALLEERGVVFEVRKYLEDAPSLAELTAAQVSLQVPVLAMIRVKEAEFKALGLSQDSTEAELLAAMAKVAKLIERPVFFSGDKAAIGRPPEKVLDIL